MPGVNTPRDYYEMRRESNNPELKVQIYLNVIQMKRLEFTRNVWMQFLLDISMEVSFLRNSPQNYR